MSLNNNTAAGFVIDDSSTLYIDTPTYEKLQGDMLGCEEKLILDNSAFNIEKEVCGTECMWIMADYWHRVERSGIKFRNFSCKDLDRICTLFKKSLINVDEAVARSVETSSSQGLVEL